MASKVLVIKCIVIFFSVIFIGLSYSETRQEYEQSIQKHSEKHSDIFTPSCLKAMSGIIIQDIKFNIRTGLAQAWIENPLHDEQNEDESFYGEYQVDPDLLQKNNLASVESFARHQVIEIVLGEFKKKFCP